MKDEFEIKNAIIESASLTTEDYGVLSGWLSLDYGGAGQGFGGLVLAVSPDSPHWPGDSNFAGVWIRRVMDVAGVTRWSNLPGKTIRVKANMSKIKAIGHIVEDKWFDPEAEFSAIEGTGGDT